jgi:selenide,water dikinase
MSERGAPEEVRLTSLVPAGGCARKLGAQDLVEVLRSQVPFAHAWVDPDVGPFEDAALLHPEGGSPLVFTVDFITPIVDDPETFGAISAANALSDVYAMGGEPQVALAICGFAADRLERRVLERIFQGGRDKAAEAGCAIVGGHTVVDPELKYGLCVLGSVAPEQRLTQTGGRPGDRLVLTKPLGFGIATQALRKGRLGEAELAAAVQAMLALNRGAKDAALAAGARAATDVTGFGLLGHLYHLLLGSRCAARLAAGAVPALDFARALAEEGLVPAGTRRNLEYVAPHASFDPRLGPAERLLLADAQTSGGLLLAVPPEREGALLRELERRGSLARAVIGELRRGEPGQIEVEAGA